MSLAFRHKAHLPDQIRLYACRDCDLAFSSPRDADSYERYYGQVANDFNTGVETFRNLEQLERLSRVITRGGLTRVLDFGCGGGGLITGLASRHPDVSFIGYDVNGGFPTGSANLDFSQTLPEGPFDLVILSHVLEHAPDPVGMVSHITSRLQPAHLYVETPDPRGYTSRSQPQHLYYVDRLHINHFGLRSLTRTVGGGYGLLEYGRYDLPYEVGPIYPGQYALFTAARCDTEGSLMDYLAGQSRAAGALKVQLESLRFYVYGFGDNFFRSRSSNGPLAGLDANILGVIDRGIEALRGELAEGWAAVHPDDLNAINGELIVCTVTQSSGLDALFATLCPDSKVIRL
ncbi:MAG: methyltransferase domain-containing protein [Caulobacteraceae bacterium]